MAQDLGLPGAPVCDAAHCRPRLAALKGNAPCVAGIVAHLRDRSERPIGFTMAAAAAAAAIAFAPIANRPGKRGGAFEPMIPVP
jgi:hypothetical protein